MEDEDFHSKVSRTEFEELVPDLFERIAAPVQQALKMAEMTMVRLACAPHVICCHGNAVVVACDC